MSQRDVEGALGRLLTDDTFRVEFFTSSARAALRAGLELSADERRALERLPVARLLELAIHIDDRICRSEAPRQPGESP